MITHKKKNTTDDNDDEHAGGSETQKSGDADTMPTGHRDEGDPLFCPLLTFSRKGGFKVDH